MFNRREVMGLLLPAGLAGTAFERAWSALAQRDDGVSERNLREAEWITGNPLGEEERKKLVEEVRRHVGALERLRAIDLDEETPLPLAFCPGTAGSPDSGTASTTVVRREGWTVRRKPDDAEQLAFLPVAELGELLRDRQVTSLELTQLYLDRLRRFDPVLHCVVNLTESLALEQAERADRELALGRCRGPLHGIPWGAKDLMSVAGFPVTWGIPGRKEAIGRRNATVVQRLHDAGAVLVAKLSLGALAMGDQWHGGQTRNPWNPGRGSSGSSAGSAAATVAGMVGFAIGSETLGSIVSPSVRCGTTSLRPTFGRISRDGCMPLSWTMDKLGPMARSVEDLALVFSVIHGADGRDPAAISRDFHWPRPVRGPEIRVGVPVQAVDDGADETLAVVRDLGCQIVPVRLPDTQPVQAILNIIDVEAAAMFDTATRKGDIEGWNTWPDTFRAAFFLPAVDYIRMQRVRWKLMQEFAAVMESVDFLVNANDLLHTNLTGHPSVVLPRVIELANGRFRPRTAVITGRLYEDDRLLSFARELELRFKGSVEHPPMERWLKEAETAKQEEPGAADSGQGGNGL